MPHKAQPVPPIYQPEVAAEAVYYAAHARRRQVYVGLSTVLAIWGDKVAPWLLDWRLARTGCASQQVPDQPEDSNGPDNLWEPLDATRDYGAHGAFDARARPHSLQVWANVHRPVVLGATVGVGGLVMATASLLLARYRG
jgi:hypothetical protein